MKKCYSIILALALIIGCVNMTYAEENTGISERTRESYEILTALGFLNSDYSEDYIVQKKDEKVSRAYFAEFIYKIFCPINDGSDASYFYDVPNAHYAHRAVAALTERKIISVPGDKMFNPDSFITQNDAAKMLLCAIGYERLAEYSGGLEQGAAKIASDINLYKGVKISADLTFSDMLVITYNALFAEVLENTVIKNGSMTMENKGNTYLSLNYDIYMEKDIVIGYNGTGIYGDSVDEDKALIGDRVLNADDFDLTDYLGTQVKYLYRYDDDTEESTLLWLSKTGQNDEIILNSVDNGIEFTETTNRIKYYTGDDKREKTVSLAPNVNVIYNGSYVKDNVTDILKSDFYALKLVSNNENEYNVAIIDSYENYEVVINDVRNEELYLKSCDNSLGTTSYISIKTDTYDMVEFVDGNGGEITQNAIEKGKIVSVFDTPGKEKLKVVYNTDVVTGEIKSIADNDTYTVLTVDESEYTIYKRGIIIRANIGATIEAKLDAYGLIATLKTTKGGVSFGYAIKAVLADDVKGHELTDTLVLKMLTEDGELLKLAATEKKITIDGVTYQKPSAAYAQLGGQNMKPQAVAYSLNNNGEIKMLDRAENYNESEPTEDNMLCAIHEKANLQYNKWTKNLGAKARLSNTTIVFGVPDDVTTARDSEYTVGGIDVFSHQDYNTASVFNYGTEYNEFADVVVLHGKVIGSGSWLSNKFVVSKTSVTLNDDNETVVMAEGYHGNIKKFVRFTENASTIAKQLKKGDIFGVDSRIGDEIDAYTVYYSPREPQTRPLNTTYAAAGGRITMFYVNDVVENSVLVGYNSGADFDEVLTPGALVLVYNSANDTLSEGSVSDIRTYKAAGDECSSLFVYYVDGEVRNFVVIN